MRKRYAPVLVAVVVGVGIYLAVGGQEESELSGDRSYAMMEERNYSGQEKHGLQYFTYRPNNSIYLAFRPNVSGWAYAPGVPPFFVETNTGGFRDDEFARDKPEGTVRILVVGDSFVFGVGVGNERTFTEVMERRLKEGVDRNYGVINGGVPGTGMKDYYLFLKHKGLEYDPDIVVVSFINNDWLSKEEEDELYRQAKEAVNTSENLTVEEVRDRTRQRFAEMRRSRFRQAEDEQTDFRYLDSIRSLVERKSDAKLLLYAVDGLTEKIRGYVENWAENNNVSFVRAPPELRKGIDYDYRVSEEDLHPNEKGHRALADTLLQALQENKLI